MTTRKKGFHGWIRLAKPAIAHTDDQGNTHDLLEHLLGTATKAEAFAAKFRSGPVASLAGRWHDLGKYHPAFQVNSRKPLIAS